MDALTKLKLTIGELVIANAELASKVEQQVEQIQALQEKKESLPVEPN